MAVMRGLLAPEIISPNHVLSQLVIGAAVVAAATGGAALLLGQAPSPRTGPAAIQLVVADDPATGDAITSREPAWPLDAGELLLIARAGERTYMKLATLRDRRMPPHETPALVASDAGTITAVAALSPNALGIEHRGWLGREVLVDGWCRATVTRFAVVSRLTGSTDYAGLEGDWTAANVMENGSRMLAAELSDCSGPFRDTPLATFSMSVARFARDARLAPVVDFVQVDDILLADMASNRMYAFDQALEANEVQHTTHVLRHPTTGVTWVVAHAVRDEGCGGDNVNAFGLFRVDQDGTLATVELRDLGELWSIDRIVDLEGDGIPELLGTDQLGMDVLVTTTHGRELARLERAFYGCAC